MGYPQENSTRNLFLIRVLFIQMSPGPCYYYLTLPYSPYSILMSASLLTQGHHVYSICPNVIFQTILPCSRLVTSHHVTCHVPSSSFFQENKITKKKSKIRKIKENKIKIVSIPMSMTLVVLLIITIYVEVLLEGLICAFGLSIIFRVVTQSEVKLYVQSSV